MVADYESNGKADFGLFFPDSKGGTEFIYQKSQTGKSVVVDFSTANDLPLTAPTYLIARMVPRPATASDFDGDGKTDVGVYGKDPTTGRYDFRILSSKTNFNQASPIVFDNHGAGFGNAQSIPVPADYFGDGQSAYAVWTPNGQGGMTFSATSSVNGFAISVPFGTTRDVPVVADVNGDGKADFGVYGPDASGKYRFDFLLSTKNFDVNQQDLFDNGGFGFGNAQSIPVVGDFDSSSKAGFGLYIPSAAGSIFTYVSPTANVSFTKTIGGLNDIPSVIDYDGDGKADLALYGPDPTNPGHYRYTVLTSSSGYDPTKAVTFDNGGFGYGGASSIPVAADYEGTGKADFALYLPDSKGEWSSSTRNRRPARGWCWTSPPRPTCR